ncbi:hypothetical protein AB0H83_49850, partial [Dactylosporangium sp. NPDC050688]
ALSGVRMPRMNAVMERWVRTCRRELLDRTLIDFLVQVMGRGGAAIRVGQFAAEDDAGVVGWVVVHTPASTASR